MKNSKLMQSVPAIFVIAALLTGCATTQRGEGVKVKTRIGELTFSHDFVDGIPSEASRKKLYDELDFQRATQAYIWGLGPVSMLQWEKDAAEKFGATGIDLVSYKTYRQKLGILTANATTPYLCAFTNLAETGPLAIEIPAGPTAGLVNDFWHRTVADLGLTGPEKGEAVKVLVLGPGQEVEDTKGYRVVRSSTFGIFWGTRILDRDPANAKRILDGIQGYSLAKGPAARGRVITPPDNKPWATSTQPRGLQYWRLLAEFIEREPVHERDKLILAMLRPLGIEKGKAFEPDARQRQLLIEAALVGEAMAKTNSFDKRFAGARFWEDAHWKELMMIHPTGTTSPHWDQLDERAAYIYEAFSTSMAMISRTPGVGQAYLGGYTDKAGRALDGAKTYRLRVPANVPAKNFFSLTLYDVSTRCLIDNPQQRADRSSRHDLVKNKDGSIDLYVGPEAPEGFERNWIPSVPGRAWFAYFRLYGPLQPHFDRTWKLPDFEEAS